MKKPLKLFLFVCLVLALCLGLSDKVQASGCRQVAVVAPGVGQLNYGGVQTIQAGGCYGGVQQLNLGGYSGVQPILLNQGLGYGRVQTLIQGQGYSAAEALRLQQLQQLRLQQLRIAQLQQGGYGIPQPIILRQQGQIYGGGGVQPIIVQQQPFFVPGQPVRNVLRALFN